MPIIKRIDIRVMDWPISILNCKKEVNQMKIGDQIEVLVKDIDVMKNLLSLIEQLSGYSIEKHREKKEYRLVIGKSEEDA